MQPSDKPLRHRRGVPPTASADCATTSRPAHTATDRHHRGAQACRHCERLRTPDAQQEPIRLCHAQWMSHTAHHTGGRALYLRPRRQVAAHFDVPHDSHSGSSGERATSRSILPPTIPPSPARPVNYRAGQWLYTITVEKIQLPWTVMITSMCAPLYQKILAYERHSMVISSSIYKRLLLLFCDIKDVTFLFRAFLLLGPTKN